MTPTSPRWSSHPGTAYAAGPDSPEWITLTRWGTAPLAVEEDVRVAPPPRSGGIAPAAVFGVLLLLLGVLLMLGLADYVDYLTQWAR